MPAQGYTSHFISAQDGLVLHLRSYGDDASRLTPVVCLPGLARTAADFDSLARELSANDRRVVALDYRGRGLSQWDKNPARYDIMTENADIQAALAAAGVESAVFIGTSRGGVHAMVLAATRPRLIRAAVLNDIGPVIESKGLARIKGYVGKLPQPRDWKDAIDLIKRLASAQFTGLGEAEWEAFARLTFVEKDGGLVAQYDPALAKGLASIDLTAKIPDLWPQFMGLAHVPLLVIRGANSDLLSIETLAEMTRRHPRCETLTVAGQGHAPLLLDAPTIGWIAAFVEAHG
jgi:pimeloyl-ACP methyl ester carboxylesterase